MTIITFMAIFAMAMRPSVDTDTFWHLRAGQWTVAQGAILTHDPFSFTRLDTPWINHSWLAQVILYWLWAAFGYAGLNLFTAALVTLAFALVYRLCEGNAYLKAFVLVLAAAASSVYWSARPQLVSFALASVFAYFLGQFVWRGANRLWALPIIMLVWVNLHGGFAIGFILIALTLAGQVAGRVLFPNDPGHRTWREIAYLAGIGAACAVVVPLNPYGVTMYGYPFRTVSIGVLQDYIQEWQSPNFHQTNAQIFIALWLALFAAVGLSRRRMNLTDLALAGGLTCSALLAGRNIPLVALVAAPIITRHAVAALEHLAATQPRLAALLNPPPSGEVARFPALNALLLGLVAFGVFIRAADSALPPTNENALAEHLPVRAVAALRAQQPAGPMFNAYNWGGYLIWELHPDYLVYVDGRTDLYDDALLREYLDVAFGRAGYAETLAKYGIRLALVETGSGLADRLAADRQWALLYKDDLAVIYQKR
jgi:hypothetical protein